jgi:hypothetical protein
VAVVHNLDWRALLDVVPKCDALIVDAPYSERTHAGHDDGTMSAERARDVATRRLTRSDGNAWEVAYAERIARGEVPGRRTINYGAWSDGDVHAFVREWSARTQGWMVSITDHILAFVWAAAFEAVGRYVFAPLPFVAPGSRVRLTGDGPSTWTCWIVVARPRNRTFASWGTLPGAYVLPEGHGGKLPVVGGKPLWLMSQLVEHYSRPGDLVVDPCCGAGTTLVAALRAGRRAIGGDVNAEHAELARLWTANPHLSAPRGERQADDKQAVLF